MFTVCPKCSLKLQVTAADLRVAQGFVRCGRCSNVFNALAGLSDEQQAALTQHIDQGAQARQPVASAGRTAAPAPSPPAPSPPAPAPPAPPAPAPPAPARGHAQRPAEDADESLSETALEFDPTRTDPSAVFARLDPDATGTFESIVLSSEDSEDTTTEETGAEDAASGETHEFDVKDLQPRAKSTPPAQATQTPSAGRDTQAAPAAAAPAPARPPGPSPRPAAQSRERVVAAPNAPGRGASPSERTPSPAPVGAAAVASDRSPFAAAVAPQSTYSTPRGAERSPGAILAAANPSAVMLSRPGATTPSAAAAPTTASAPAPITQVPVTQAPAAAAARARAEDSGGLVPSVYSPQAESTGLAIVDVSDTSTLEQEDRTAEHALGARWHALTGRRALQVGSALLAVLLSVQLVHHYRTELAGVPGVRSAVSAVYAGLGMPITPHWDVSAYEVHQLGAVAGVPRSGLLTLRASLKNTARTAQPLPLLRVVLQDRFGNRVAARDVAPVAYLPAGERAMMLAPGQRIDAQVAFVDPGPSAEGFELDACLADRLKRVLCANDVLPAP
jgi:predicted Zn finger-like uncharacterized protein